MRELEAEYIRRSIVRFMISWICRWTPSPCSARFPNRIFRRPGAVTARVLRMHHALDAELEREVVASRRHAAAGQVGADLVGDGGVIDESRAARHEELVVDLVRREGVERVAAVALQIAALVTRPDERVEMAIDDSRANRMEARRAVLPQRREERKPNAELIEHLPPSRRDIRRISLEFIPGRHWICPP